MLRVFVWRKQHYSLTMLMLMCVRVYFWWLFAHTYELQIQVIHVSTLTCIRGCHNTTITIIINETVFTQCYVAAAQHISSNNVRHVLLYLARAWVNIYFSLLNINWLLHLYITRSFAHSLNHLFIHSLTRSLCAIESCVVYSVREVCVTFAIG